MRIYKDIFTDDEMCADTYPMKVDNGVILEFTGKYVVRKEGEIVLAGSNASAEGEDADDAADDSGNVERGIDIILSHRLVDMTSVYGDAKQFKDFIKTYMGKLAKKLKEDGKSEEELKEWQKNMQAWVVGLIKKERFKDLMFYSGPAEDAIEGQLAILEYRDMEGGEKPIVMLIKDGLIDEKV